MSIKLDLSDAPPFFQRSLARPAVGYRPVRPGATPGWLRKQARPRAMRAAGQAMARNRFSLIIPCHRVIASDGGLGGYGGGGLGCKGGDY